MRNFGIFLPKLKKYQQIWSLDLFRKSSGQKSSAHSSLHGRVGSGSFQSVQRLQPPSFQKEKKKVTDISALDLQFADWPDVFFHMSVGQEKNKNNLQQTNKQNKTTTKQQPTMSSSKNQSTKTPATSAKSTSRHSAAQAAALVSGGHNLRSSSRGGAGRW